MLYAFELHLQSARKAPKRTATTMIYNCFCNSYEQHFPIKQSRHEFITRPKPSELHFNDKFQGSNSNVSMHLCSRHSRQVLANCISRIKKRIRELTSHIWRSNFIKWINTELSLQMASECCEHFGNAPWL
jgi:hypothetical protein